MLWLRASQAVELVEFLIRTCSSSRVEIESAATYLCVQQVHCMHVALSLTLHFQQFVTVHASYSAGCHLRQTLRAGTAIVGKEAASSHRLLKDGEGTMDVSQPTIELRIAGDVERLADDTFTDKTRLEQLAKIVLCKQQGEKAVFESRVKLPL